TISNLIADAQLWAVHDLAATDNLPVIAFMNPGGVRTDIEAGDVTYKEAADVQPFANTLETLDLTGAQIKQVLEEQWQPGEWRQLSSPPGETTSPPATRGRKTLARGSSASPRSWSTSRTRARWNRTMSGVPSESIGSAMRTACMRKAMTLRLICLR